MQPVLLPFLEEEVDEVADVLTSLHLLAARVTNPVVKACLEEVQEEIAFLTSRDEQEEAQKVQRKVA